MLSISAPRTSRLCLRFLVAAAVLSLPVAIAYAASTVSWSLEANGLPTNGDYAAVAFGDVDNDGELDLITGSGDNHGLVVWAKIGLGTWSSAGMSQGLPSTGSYGAIATGDLNNDGKLDIVAGSISEGGMRAWLGEGGGNWLPYSGGLPSTGSFASVALADLNHDGLLDLVAGARSTVSGVRVYVNGGSGWDVHSAPTIAGAYDAVAVGYVNEDGHYDIAAAQTGASGSVQVWLGSASGSWTARPGFAATTGGYRGVALGDFDGDGKTDLVSSLASKGLRAARGDGRGNWIDSSTGLPAQGNYANVSLVDVNLDGRPDIVAGAGDGRAGIEVWRRGAAGWSLDFAEMPTDTGVRNSVAVGDFTNDGLPDLAATRNSGLGVQTWLHTGARETLGTWQQVQSPLSTGSPSSLAVADFDLDGYLDVVYPKPAGLAAMLGDGGGKWVSCDLDEVATTGSFEDVWAGRVRPDSLYPDVIGAEKNGGNGTLSHYVNDGGCTWITSTISVGRDYRALSVGDIDRDGAPEVVAALSTGGPYSLYVWEYRSGWSSPQKLPVAGAFFATALGDVNHDGKLAVVAVGEPGVTILTYAGPGSWTTTVLTNAGGTYPFYAVALGDLNQDGHLDLVAGRNGNPPHPDDDALLAWRGDGAGGWIPAAMPVSEFQDVLGLDLADFNHDGKLDLLVSYGQSPQGIKVWTGNGAGGWMPATTGLPNAPMVQAGRFAHVDHDGNLDVLAAGAGQGIGVWRSVESTPPTFRNFWATGWINGWITNTQAPTITAQVSDTGSGLDPASASCEYSTNFGGGTLWNPIPVTPTVSGQPGSTSQETLMVVAPFHQDSADKNAVRCSISDVNRNETRSDPFVVKVDTTPPSNTTTVSWPGHTAGDWTKDRVIDATWLAASDSTSGVQGYSIVIGRSISAPVPEKIVTPSQSYTSDPLADGEWYILLRTKDNVGHWSPTAVITGPFKIDTTPPSNPTELWSDTHTASQWSSRRQISVRWRGAADGGSGLKGYSYVWDSTPGTIPDTSVDWPQEYCGDSCGISDTRAEGQHYFHLRTVDLLDQASGTMHLGPFQIDSTDPFAAVHPLPYKVESERINISLDSLDNLSGIATYDVQYRDMTPGVQLGGIWFNFQREVTATSFVFTGKWGHRYQFRALARDRAGNVSTAWGPNDYDTETRIDFDLEVTGLEVTQGIQDLNNSMPLVAERTTTVRAYVRTSQELDELMPAALHAFRGGVELSDSPHVDWLSQRPISRRTRAGADSVFDFRLTEATDPNWLAYGTVTFRVVVNPDSTLYEWDRTNNDREATVTFNMNLLVGRPPEVSLVLKPVHLHDLGVRDNPVLIYPPDEPDLTRMLTAVERYHPVAKVNTYIDRIILQPDRHDWPIYEDEYDLQRKEDRDDLAGDLAALDAFSDGPPDVHYLGLVHPEVSTGPSGVGSVGGSGMWVRMNANSWREDEGLDLDDPRGSWIDTVGGQTIAHELGHNKGLRHMPCNNEEQYGGSVDSHYPWPYPDCRLAANDPNGFYGFDWYTDIEISNDDNDGDSRQQRDAFPMMGYQQPSWISPYEYCKLLNAYNLACDLYPESWPWQELETAVRANPLAFADADRLRVLQQANRYLLVGGRVDLKENTGVLRLVHEMSSPPTHTVDKAARRLGNNVISALAGDPSYNLVQLDAGGGVLDSHLFYVSNTSHDGSVTGFLELVPLMTDTARLELRKGATVLAERAASQSPPTVQLLAPNGGDLSAGTRVSWSASDPDGDTLSFNVMYSVDNGQKWSVIAMGIISDSFTIPAGLPGSQQGRLRIVANDGFRTAQDDSDGTFVVANTPPYAAIVEPTPGSTVAPESDLVVRGLATDAEDGPLSGSRLAWRSSRQGSLGTGEGLRLSSLPTGTNFLTLTVTDAGDQSASASVAIFVGDAPPLALTPATAAISITPGSILTYTLRLTNTGDLTDTFTLRASGNQWPISLPSSVGPLAPGATINISVSVTIPPTATVGTIDTASITAAYQSIPGFSTSTRLATTAASIFTRVYIPLAVKNYASGW